MSDRVETQPRMINEIVFVGAPVHMWLEVIQAIGAAAGFYGLRAEMYAGIEIAASTNEQARRDMEELHADMVALVFGRGALGAHDTECLGRGVDRESTEGKLVGEGGK